MRIGSTLLTLLVGCMAGFIPLIACAGEPPQSSGGGLTLNAVFQSRHGGMALIDGVQYRPGDRVGGTEILAIERGAIRLRTGAGEYTAWVGFDLPGNLAPLPSNAQQQPVGETLAETGEVDSRTTVADGRTYVVSYGDTLSSIARRHRPDGMPLERVISALLQTNRGVIGEDINTIYAGSTLKIPRLQDPEKPAKPPAERPLNPGHLATIDADRPLIGPEQTDSTPAQLVTVEPGDTLSGIAQRLEATGLAKIELMQALFDENPGAFGGSMDVLYAGALLRVPPHIRLPSREPAYADALASAGVLDSGKSRH